MLSFSLKVNKSLKSLNLSDTEFIFKGALDLLDALNYNFTLCKVILQNNALKEETKAMIQEKIDRNKNLKNETEMPKLRKEGLKLKKRLSKQRRTRQSMEDEIAKIQEEKKSQMNAIMGHGDKLSEMIDQDR